jgi:hypothetical protein
MEISQIPFYDYLLIKWKEIWVSFSGKGFHLIRWRLLLSNASWNCRYSWQIVSCPDECSATRFSIFNFSKILSWFLNHLCKVLHYIISWFINYHKLILHMTIITILIIGIPKILTKYSSVYFKNSRSSKYVHCVYFIKYNFPENKIMISVKTHRKLQNTCYSDFIFIGMKEYFKKNDYEL